jgi:hypothetical protein
MTRLIAGILVAVSGVFLYFALTQPIVKSHLVSLGEMVRVIYSTDVYEENQAAAAAKAAADAAAAGAPAPAPVPTSTADYEARVAQYEKLFTTVVLNTESAKKNFASLTAEKGYTAWESARVLYDAGDWVSGSLIVGFSIVYPVAKTLALLLLVVVGIQQKTALRLAEWTHKYTMLDVFVAAVTLVAVSTQRLLVIDTGPAIVWYVLYLVAGYASVMMLIRVRPKEAAALAP